VACLGFAAGVHAQAPDYSRVEYRTEKLTEHLFVLFGAGGNVAVLTGADGALVVDADVVEMSPKLRAALSLVSDKPVRFLIDTHFHFDHTGGNPTFGRGGTVIVAHDNVRARLMTRQVIDLGVEIPMEPAPREGLPVITFADGLRFHVNDEEISVIHAPHAHTDSDAFVFFEKANVLHTGDLMMSIGYPFIDAGNGGSLGGLIAAQEKALGLVKDTTRVIPGHGPLVTRSELQAYHDALATIYKRISDLVKKGRSLEQIKTAAPTREFDERWGKGVISPDMLIQRAFIELKAASRKTGPASP
jgi:glyoxylase-like metal-dependent hydrolase (beta-lactamase superfamily II)